MLKIFEKNHLRYQEFVFQFAVLALAKGKPIMTKIVWVMGGGGGNYFEKLIIYNNIYFRNFNHGYEILVLHAFFPVCHI